MFRKLGSKLKNIVEGTVAIVVVIKSAVTPKKKKDDTSESKSTQSN